MSAAEEDYNHHIEQSAQVYLHLVDGRWEVDSPSDDGYPLQGYDDGALHEECECIYRDDAEAIDRGERAALASPDSPTLPELYAILRRYFGDED